MLVMSSKHVQICISCDLIGKKTPPSYLSQACGLLEFTAGIASDRLWLPYFTHVNKTTTWTQITQYHKILPIIWFIIWFKRYSWWKYWGLYPNAPFMIPCACTRASHNAVFKGICIIIFPLCIHILVWENNILYEGNIVVIFPLNVHIFGPRRNNFARNRL